MLRFLTWVWGGIRALLGLILPLFSSVQVSRLARVVWIVVHVVLVVAIVVGLHLLNAWQGLHLNVPTAPEWLRKNYLPVLFLLVYVLCWLSWWLWKLLVSEEEEGRFPDIDEAWSAALAALARARGDLRDLPMFLVLGQPQEDDETCFQAAQLQLTLRGAPGASAPVRLYASAEGLFVTCPTASVLSHVAGWLAGKSPPGTVTQSMAEVEELEESKTLTPEMATMMPGGGGGGDGHLVEMQSMIVQAERERRKLTPSERREMRRLHRKSTAARSARLSATALETQAARLRHVCRLLVRDRRPRCGVNGILVLLPFAATDTAQDATDCGDGCQRDLKVARAALGVHCPVVAVVCDMESAPGFTAFVERFTPPERRRRMGQRCPLVPGYTAAEGNGAEGVASAGAMYRSLSAWLCKGFMRQWIYQKSQLEKPGGMELSEAMDTNSNLFLLLHEMIQRQEHLAIILEGGFSHYAPENRLLFGGCYLAATGGGDARPYQAFMAGVIERLMEAQDVVLWTEEVRREEARLQGWINLGWTVLVLLLVLGSVALGYVIYNRPG
jgi:hypothetical protein